MASIHTKMTKSNEVMHYSLTEKESESKIGFNKRLLVLVDDKFIGYIREKDFNLKDIHGTVDVAKIKKRIMLKDIRRILNINRDITLMINELDKNGKLGSLKWLFRMETEALARNWVELLDRSGSPNPSRKTTEHKDKEKDESKNPSIKDFVKGVEGLAKQQEDNNKKGLEKQKQRVKLIENSKQPEEQKQRQIQMKISMQQKLKATEKEEMSVPPKPKRQSQLTFSFKGQQSEEQDNYSPPKKQSQVILPHPVLEKIKKMESNLSVHLEERVDLNLVERELNQLKQSRGNPANKGEFKQLSENLTNRQREIQGISFLNYFREVMGSINDKKYQDFYNFCEIKMKELFLQNFEDQASLANWIEFIRVKNGVRVELIMTELKQIPGNSSICDEGLLKTYLDKAKNTNYLWKIISHDEVLPEVFLIPMTCMVEYQGVIAYFTCQFNSPPLSQTGERSQDFSQHFESLARLTRINKVVLQKSSCVKFSKFSSDRFVISEVNEYLPRLLSTNCQIRPQMFSSIAESVPEEKQEKSFSSQSASLYGSSRASRKEQEQENRYFKEPLEQSIRNLTRNLNRLEEYVVHPSQLSKLMHLYGLNMVMMAQVYKQIENPFMKGIIKTEAALRSFKVIYRKKMQELLLAGQPEPQGTKQPTVPASPIVRITKSLVNVLLGKRESGKLWEMITTHSQVNFRLAIDKEEMNKGYLFLGLEHQLGIRMETKYSTCDKIFGVDPFVASVEFVCKTRPCELYWLDESIYGLPLGESVGRVMSELGLREKQLPFYLYQDKNMQQKIFEIISLHYGPNSPEIRHLPVYRDSESSSQHTLFYYRRKISEIKWQIKIHSENRATDMGVSKSLVALSVEQKVEKLREELGFYFGSYHPFYSQFYQILISIYEKEHNYEKVEQYSKLSLTNTLQLCGGNTMHIKLANSYYHKGEFYEHWGRLDEAILNYKKTKNILEYNEYVQSKEYAVVEMRLAGLYFCRFKDAECARMLDGCFRLFCLLIGLPLPKDKRYPEVVNKGKPQPDREAPAPTVTPEEQEQIYRHMVTCLQLLDRCSQSSLVDKSATLLGYCLTVLQNCLQPTYPLHQVQLPDSLTIKVLKILVQNYFSVQSKQISKEFFLFMENVCDELNVGGARLADPTTCLDAIKDLIVNGKLMDSLGEFGEKAEACILENKSNAKIIRQMANKKLETFSMVMRALVVTLGEGFILGVLNDQYK